MRVVVLSGGPAHDFPATTARLTALLDGGGATAEVHTVVDDAFAALPGAALLVVNALRWTMTAPDRYRDRATADGVSPSAASRDALAAHLAAGGGVLAVHTAALCFDDWPGWADALGGAWEWGRSHHPPVGPAVDVAVADGEHSLTRGLDGFRLVDEVYADLRRAPDVTGLLTAVPPAGDPAEPPAGDSAGLPGGDPAEPSGGHPAEVPGGDPAEPSGGNSAAPPDGAAQPVLWAREHGGGRVVYDALGHHPSSYDVPEHAEIVRRAVRWTTGG